MLQREVQHMEVQHMGVQHKEVQHLTYLIHVCTAVRTAAHSCAQLRTAEIELYETYVFVGEAAHCLHLGVTPSLKSHPCIVFTLYSQCNKY